MSEDYEIFSEYFNNFNKFEAKQFDKVLKHTFLYASEHGLNEDDLILFSNISFKQQLGVIRFRNVIKCLIPKGYMPDKVVENVLGWFLEHYFGGKPLLVLKLVLQWFVGVLEYNLLSSNNIIDKYYDLFYYFLPFEILNVPACQLIYILTKPNDVSRWYVKQILKVHEKYHKPKYTGSLLYLFKSYRPDCVPENIPPYARHKSFGVLPEFITKYFSRAQTKIDRSYTITNSIDEIFWYKADSQSILKRKDGIRLIPSIMEGEVYSSLPFVHSKSLLNITTCKDLYQFHLTSSYPSRILSLLSTTEGCFLLAFGDKLTQQKFSIQLHYVLHEAFFERNQKIPFQEKERLLKRLSIFQNLLQQSLAVVSEFLKQFIKSWDGFEHEQYIYSLMQWFSFKSFDHLKKCILNYIYDFFISGTLEMKCNILNFLANFTRNIINSYVRRNVEETSTLFFDNDITWDIEEVIDNLYSFINKICDMGLYLENYHCLIVHTIINLQESIMTIEQQANVRRWNLSLHLLYTCLFSTNPTCFIRIFNLFNRFNSYVPVYVKEDFLNSLWHKNAFVAFNSSSVLSSFNSQKFTKLNQLINISECYSCENHFALLCYNSKLKSSGKDFVSDTEDFIQNARENYPDLIQFLANHL